MGTEYYLVVKDKKKKRALVVDLGKGFSTDTNKQDYEKVAGIINELDELIEDFENLDERRYCDLTLEDLQKLLTLKQLVEDLKYSWVAPDLMGVLVLYGLVSALVPWWKEKDYEWYIVSEYGFAERVEDELKEEGYEIIMWI